VFRLTLAEHDLLVPDVVLVELRRVLRTKFKMPATRLNEIETFLREHEVIAKPTRLLDLKVRDPADAWVLASAVAGHASVLVTGDKDLLVLGTDAPLPILDPRAFWMLVRGEPA